MKLLPQPRKIRSAAGVFDCRKAAIVLPSFAGSEELSAALSLQREVHNQWGFHLPIEKWWRVKKDEDTIALVLESKVTRWFVGMPVSAPADAEGYKLTIRPGIVLICSRAISGLMQGVRTFGQVARQCEGGQIPCGTISDKPALKIRGLLLDVTRGKVPTMETLKTLIDFLSEWKINMLQFYTEFAFYYRRRPEMPRSYGMLYPEQIVELDEYCRQRHMELVPNQQSSGHMQHVLSQPALRHLAEEPPGARPWTLSPSEPGTYRLLDDLYADLLPCFSSSRFNVNCDETHIAAGKSRHLAKKLGRGKLYLSHVLKVRELAAEYGKKIMLWGDMFLQSPEVIPDIPKDVTILNWNYNAGHDWEGTSRRFLDAGLKVWHCPGAVSSGVLFPRLDNAIANADEATSSALKLRAEGVLNTDWGCLGHIAPLGNSIMPIAYTAAKCWNPHTDWKAFRQAFELHVLGGDCKGFTDAFDELGTVETLLGEPVRYKGLSQRLWREARLENIDISRFSPGKLTRARRITREAIDVTKKLKNRQTRFPGLMDELNFAARQLRLVVEKAAYAYSIQKAAAGANGDPEKLRSLADALRAARKQLSRWYREIAAMKEEFRRLWLARNTPEGYLKEDLRWWYSLVLARLRRQATRMRGRKYLEELLKNLDAKGK